MGGRGGSGRSIAAPAAPASTPAPAPQRPMAAQSLEGQILETYDRLVSRPGGLLSLVKLRASLPNVDRATMDAELKRLDRARIILLDPDVNQKALPPEAHRDAIRVGGEPKHFISR